MTVLEVRCCCQPRKVLGWLEVPEHRAQAGERASFPLTATWRPGRVLLPESVTLPVATVMEYGHAWPALKAEGVTIERLRRIQGFRENANHATD